MWALCLSGEVVDGGGYGTGLDDWERVGKRGWQARIRGMNEQGADCTGKAETEEGTDRRLTNTGMEELPGRNFKAGDFTQGRTKRRSDKVMHGQGGTTEKQEARAKQGERTRQKPRR
eukprot:CAMPEP_0181327432 /NCGR_PEP_ID=MMETSP1101-20121128/22099_1 /TAXON_ID=46948 /ORGANISM="Rhodomonas abbreviata, Strain Caron Lab Isolate" /LENGTH=116 /DNA_ID=CAMNT_0023436093 /DNA_START=214 /DNA_END=564 /DNA_ORIENTATION=+